MRILVMTEEEEFYLPLSIDYLLDKVGEQVLEVVCVRNRLLPSKFKAARKFCKIFGIGSVLHHGCKLAKAKILDRFGVLNSTGRNYSVKQVCRKYKIPYLLCDDINAADFLEHCQQLKVEIIACVSPSQIFKENLINLPKYGCINIHTAKLPKYRGLYPTYWAMACGEKTVGISIHYIDKKIDTGKIILQDEVEIPPKVTLGRMLTITKLRGVELLVKAISQIASGTAQAYTPEGKGTYFSYPTPESYKTFRSLGYKLW